MELSSASPATLGKYQIRGVLGRGAMGTVYDGWDPVIGRRVAIKTVRLLGDADPEVQEGLERFKREAQAAGRLSHPNVVGVYDYGETDETAYIVMEFVEGPSLKQLLDARERFPIGETARIMDQILAGLQFSHEHGVVHRDIKPGNVMIAKGGRVKLADFGIARIESSVMTQDGTMLGTPAYMSPEQLMAQTVDARSDIYSAGVVLYQLLTGERPFEGGLTAIIHKALNTVPPRPSEIAVTSPPNLDGVVARAMARRPADRYPSADSFAQALRTAVSAPASVFEPAPIPPNDDEATVVARPPAAPPVPAPAQTMPPPPAPAPAPPVLPQPVTASGGSNKALLGGVAAVVAIGLGVGGWLVMRPASSPAPTAAQTQFASREPPPTVSPAAPPPAPPQGAVRVPEPVGASPPAVPAPAPKTNPPAPSPVAETPASQPETPPAAAPPAPQAASPPATAPASSPPAPAPPPVAQHPVTQALPTAPAAPVPPAPAPTVQATVPPPSPAPATSTPSGTPAPTTEMAGILPPNPAAIRETLASLALSASCAVPRFSVSEDGGISASGFVGTGAPDTALRGAVNRAVGSAQLSWLMVPVDGPYRDAFNIVRPIAQTFSPTFGLTLKDDITRLRDNDPIRPIVKLPDFPSYLQVDYLSHDGSVLHLLSSVGGKAKAHPAGNTLALGNAKEGVGAVGPPFGTDVILAVASSAPLFAKLRPSETETVQDYLPALQAAVDAARRSNGKLTGRVLVLETAPR